MSPALDRSSEICHKMLLTYVELRAQDGSLQADVRPRGGGDHAAHCGLLLLHSVSHVPPSAVQPKRTAELRNSSVRAE